MKISITKATEEEIKEFDERVWQGEDIEYYGEPIEWVKKEFVFKATEGKEIVGTVKCKFTAGVIYIGTLIVAKDRRKQGIGRKLMSKVEDYGKEHGAHKIYLFTMEEWEASRFYKSLGFEKIGDLPNHYLKRDFVIYSKDI